MIGASAIAAGGVAAAAAPEEENEEIESAEEDFEDYDLNFDLTPEGKVRRAAWNKGLRCRRNYGPYTIQTAFVKSKVAVFVLETDDRTELDETLESKGWTVLRFKESDITDGQEQADLIKQTHKANLRALKKKKKRK